MSASPSIACVITTYNRSGMLIEALSSAADQTLACTEIIVIDDGSTDGTKQAVEIWCSTHPEVKLRYVAQRNQGVSAARNAGWRLAQSDWVAFLDSDDVWTPDHNAILLDGLAQFPATRLVVGTARRWHLRKAGGSTEDDATTFDTAGIIAESPCVAGQAVHQKLLLGSFIPMCSTLVSRKLIEESGGFDPDRNIGEDRLFFLECFRRTEVVLCPRPCAKIRYHDDNQTHHKRALSNALKTLELQEYLLENRSVFGMQPETEAALRARIQNMAKEISRLSMWESLAQMRRWQRTNSHGERYRPLDFMKFLAVSIAKKLGRSPH